MSHFDDSLDALHESLVFALEKYPEQMEVLPLDELVLDSARVNEKRPAFLKIAVPDEAVKALRGPATKRERVYALVSFPREIEARAQSNIILPGE